MATEGLANEGFAEKMLGGWRITLDGVVYRLWSPTTAAPGWRWRVSWEGRNPGLSGAWSTNTLPRALAWLPDEVAAEFLAAVEGEAQ